MSAYPGQKEYRPPFIVHAHVTSYDNPDPDSFMSGEEFHSVDDAGYGVPTFPQLAPTQRPGGSVERRPLEVTPGGFRYRARFDGI